MSRANFFYSLLALLIGGFVLFCIYLVWQVLAPVNSMQDTYKRLQQHGASAQGQVVGIEQTNTLVNNQPVARVAVRYAHDGKSREVTFEQVMPMTVLPRVQPGLTVPLRVDAAPDGTAVVDLVILERPRG